MAGQDGAGARGLDRAEALELLGLHRDLRAEADLARRAADERDTVRVERLVNRGRARLGAGDGHTGGSLRGLVAERRLVAVAEVLDDRGLHRELDQVRGQGPDDVLQTQG